MSTNNSFINEYGEDAFYCVFDSLSSYVNSRSQLIQKEYHDMHYLQCTGCCLLDGKVIVIVEDSIDRGSQILEYGDDILPSNIPNKWKRDIILNRLLI